MLRRRRRLVNVTDRSLQELVGEESRSVSASVYAVERFQNGSACLLLFGETPLPRAPDSPRGIVYLPGLEALRYLPQQIEHQEAISHQSLWFQLACLAAAFPPRNGLLGPHRCGEEILAQRARDVITKLCCRCENISLTMNLHTTAVIFHNLILLKGEVVCPRWAAMNHVLRG